MGLEAPSQYYLTVKLMCASIAAQCAAEGVLLDQPATIKLEERLEATQRHRSFGPSAYCRPLDSLKHCPGLRSSEIKSSTRSLGKSLPDTILEPLKDAMGTYIY